MRVLKGYAVFANSDECKELWKQFLCTEDGQLDKSKCTRLNNCKALCKKYIKDNQVDFWMLKNWEVRKVKVIVGGRVK